MTRAGGRVLIWDFDGTLAHRRSETGWSILLAEWMVGDNVVADVLGAAAVGIPAVLVRRPDLRAARYADSLTDVDAFLVEEVAAA